MEFWEKKNRKITQQHNKAVRVISGSIGQKNGLG
jgi:hypothetical protein